MNCRVFLSRPVILLSGLLLIPLFAMAEPAPGVNHPNKLPPVEPFESPNRFSLKKFRAYVENKSGLIIDARSEIEYRKGHVPGALSLPVENFGTRYAELKTKLETDKAQPIVIYCSNFSCNASNLLQEKLFALGYAQISLFPNGWATWHQAGLAVETSD